MQFKTILFFFVILLTAAQSRAQNTRIDTIPFTLNKKLLVFKGAINGVAVDFAFDTGAGAGLANSAVLSKTSFTVKESNRKVSDANLNTIRLSNTEIEKLAIGNYVFNDVKGVMYDTEFLQCNGLYLLGMDVIGKLNWRINFSTQLLEVSELPFPVATSAIPLAIKYVSNRPVSELAIPGMPKQKCLIDFGFVGGIELPETAYLNTVFGKKLLNGQAAVSLTSNMSVTGMGKADTAKYFRLDSLSFGQIALNNVAVTILEKTNPKIGVGFFNAYCSEVVLNHKTNTYYVTLNNKPQQPVFNYDCRVGYVNGKLLVTAKSLLPSSTGSGFIIGEEVKTLNGKAAADYAGNCEFLNFMYPYKEASFVLEKMNGEKVTISRARY